MQVLFSADSLMLDLLKLHRTGNPLISAIGDLEWTCRDIEPGSPLAFKQTQNEMVSESYRGLGGAAKGKERKGEKLSGQKVCSSLSLLCHEGERGGIGGDGSD